MSDGFRDAFGRDPEGVWAAPGRVNVIGEFTDYNDGFVLPIALPHVTRAAIARRDDGRLRVVSAQLGPGGGTATLAEATVAGLEPEAATGWAAYVFGVAWALREAGRPVGGADVHIDSNVPIGAGLSSSAALECSVALGLRDLFSLRMSRERLALLAQRAENDFVGVPCGIMDQTASLRCRAGRALLLDTRSLATRQVPFDLAREGLVLLVLDTRVQHNLGTSAYAERRWACEEAARVLGVRALRDVEAGEMRGALARIDDPVIARRARHVITENARVLEVVRLLDAGRPREVGPVLSAGHESLRDDFEVSAPELDTAVGAARSAGALGARMVGGGFGGSAIALVDAGRAAAVEAAVRAAFAERGFGSPRVFVAVPSGMARRLA
ncbi:MAG TPA: galactokinase [Acidimicrobiales bacterium]|nr:galactokinase [Acidimicrobiales bacterium]